MVDSGNGNEQTVQNQSLGDANAPALSEGSSNASECNSDATSERSSGSWEIDNNILEDEVMHELHCVLIRKQVPYQRRQAAMEALLLKINSLYGLRAHDLPISEEDEKQGHKQVISSSSEEAVFLQSFEWFPAFTVKMGVSETLNECTDALKKLLLKEWEEWLIDHKDLSDDQRSKISLQGLAMANKDNQFVKMFPEGPDKFLVESPFPTPIKIDPSIEDLRSAYVSVFLEMALRATASVKTLQKALMNNCTQDF